MNRPRFPILLSLGILTSPLFGADAAVSALDSIQGREPAMLLKGKGALGFVVGLLDVENGV